MSCNFLALILIDPPVAHPPGSVTTSSQAAAGQSWGERLQQSGLGGPNPPPPPHPHHHPHHHHHHHHQQQQQHDQDCSSSPGNLLLARHPTITPTPYQNSTEKLVPTLPLALGFSTYSGPFLPSYESHAQHAEGPLPALELWPRQRQQGHQCQRQLQQTDAAWGAITNDKNHQLSMKNHHLYPFIYCNDPVWNIDICMCIQIYIYITHVHSIKGEKNTFKP